MTRRIGSLSRRTWSLSAVSLAAAALTAAALATPSAGLAAVHAHAAGYRHRSVGNLDCNGHSPIQHPVKIGGNICAEVHGGTHTGTWRTTGTTSVMTSRRSSSTRTSRAHRPTSPTCRPCPATPRALPTVHGPLKDITHFFELMPALWYAMALCDPNSYPLLPCQPDSDSNSPHGNYPGGGSAFLELQFYPPGFAPFADGLSCDNSHWCAALTIDSLECTGRVRRLQQQLRRAGQLRIHPDQRRAHRATEPAEGQPQHRDAEPAHAADEPR